ncbi:MAG: ribosomal RNA small subunit methyltransferase A [Elusimicrobia bacterium]|nr:ribosomal RNA small subunit methyltransferase A [Elusimicrobiota bacterium]
MPAKFAQHFLKNKGIIGKIISVVPRGENILEVGPGRGALTEHLLGISKKLVCVEKDEKLAGPLAEICGSKAEIINEDILKVRKVFDEDFFIVGNLPFYLSKKIIFYLAELQGWKKAFLMFQKEMTEKIFSPCGSSGYGKIAITFSVFFSGKKLFDVSKGSFSPPPKVDVSFVLAENKNAGIDAKKWRKFLDFCFLSRRKFLFTNLKRAGYKDLEGVFRKLALSRKARPQEISPGKFLSLFIELENAG